MKQFTITHELNCSADNFWTEVMFNHELNEALHRQVLHFQRYNLLELRETDKDVFQRVDCQPKMNLPGPVARVLGDDFRYTEETLYEKTTGIAHFTSAPPDGCTSTQQGKITNEGDIKVEAIDANKCRRIIEFRIDAKITLVGWLIEMAGEKEIREGYDKGATFINGWLAKKKL